MGTSKRQTEFPHQSGNLRHTLSGCLRGRKSEIEEAALFRISALSDLSKSGLSYAEGQRAALSAALDYGLTVIERGEEYAPPIPSVLLSQARLAARSGVGIDSMLRNYIAGNVLLTDFLLQHAGTTNLQSSLLQRVIRDLSAVFERLLAAVTDEYRRELSNLSTSKSERHADRIHKLLAGELLDTSRIAYEFDSWHLGMIVTGTEPDDVAHQLAATLERPHLTVKNVDGTVWSWLGGQRRVEPEELDLADSRLPADSCSIGLGEPAKGISGWRLTHRQAYAALRISMGTKRSPIHYADIAVVASIIQDDLLSISLRELYLAPLSKARDGGDTLKETLRAYVAAQRNVSSTAAALGVSRRTVTNRLRIVEERLGRPLVGSLTGLEAALLLEEFEAHSLQAHSLSIDP